MSIYVYTSSMTIPFGDLGQALNSVSGITGVRQQLRRLMARSATSGPIPIPSDLQFLIDRYSEQVTSDAKGDLDKFFLLHTRRGTTPGGLPTRYLDPTIMPKDMRPSNTAISAVGEGLAGWYAESHLRLRPFSRPIGEGPDFIFEDRSAPGRLVLAEVKSTQEPLSIRERMLGAALPDGLRYLRQAVDPRVRSDHSLLVMGLAIRSASDYELWNLQVSLS